MCHRVISGKEFEKSQKIAFRLQSFFALIDINDRIQYN